MCHFCAATFPTPVVDVGVATITGLQRDNLEFDDVGVFTPTITLSDGPAEKLLTVSFDIQGAKDFGSARLGLLEATWQIDDASASSFSYVTQAPSSGTIVAQFGGPRRKSREADDGESACWAAS